MHESRPKPTYALLLFYISPLISNTAKTEMKKNMDYMQYIVLLYQDLTRWTQTEIVGGRCSLKITYSERLMPRLTSEVTVPVREI